MSGQRNRQADFSNFEGDATFADYLILASYSHRFGKSGRSRSAEKK